jgi:hypothetical protein
VVKRLGDRKRRRPPRGRKVTLRVVATIKEAQEQSAIVAFRMAAALKQQYGIELSPATCGRIRARNRDLYGIRMTPSRPPAPKKSMPYATQIPHRWWSVDLCSIEQHHVPGVNGPLSIWTILDSASRSIVCPGRIKSVQCRTAGGACPPTPKRHRVGQQSVSWPAPRRDLGAGLHETEIDCIQL